ncbi:eukaryotic translation initiation factor 5C [Fomitopsis serialis]|uniref:eukaryotic translation initiation factor 5C n=1 Tax=Fomitopsis serialis TaxID=139415 RepID=UPI002007F982|nr:eukaryotic translation initiation factor 5C [Neoantrodia serialis]KAH9935623.1 eukaryotic translation initiation factor 5C [Neoantrodia serialis]
MDLVSACAERARGDQSGCPRRPHRALCPFHIFRACRNLWMSQQAAVPKPTLQGVRIRARKGAVKAHAKHEPTTFRDQLYKHLETVPATDFEGITNKLVQAGSTLEYLKYAEALFEILLIGGLLQPGGNYLDDGAPPSPFSVLKAKEPVEVADIKQYVDVLNKLIRRYKYLQKPLEETSLPTLLQYINRWTDVQRDKLALAIALIMARLGQCELPAKFGQGPPREEWCVRCYQRRHTVFRGYLSEQSMDHLAASLKRGGIKDLLAFFPDNKRQDKVLDDHFRKAGLAQVADWWTKRQYASMKEDIIKTLHEMLEHETPYDEIVAAIRSRQEERPLPETELIQCIWQALVKSIEWSARQDQNEALAIREITNFTAILEPFCNGPKTEVALINTVQVYCYEDTRIIKAFPQILKVLYNKDCISDQAIIYWHQKGAKPQGKQHFLQATQALVKFLQQQEESEEEE